MFRARLPSIFSTSQKCHACHRICTLSPLEAALTMRLAKTRNTTPLKCCACHAKWRWRSPKCCACHENATHLLKTKQKYCACPTKRLSTRYETCWNVTNSHACHAKRGYTTLETAKSDPFCRTRHRHGHTGLARTVANGCGRLRAVAQRLRNVERTHPQPPDPQSETGTLATHSGKWRFFSGKRHCTIAGTPRRIWSYPLRRAAKHPQVIEQMCSMTKIIQQKLRFPR